MVLGLDEKPPHAGDYESFEEELVEGLSNMSEGLSLLIYGSYERKEHVSGRSDIDGILNFPGGVVIDKEDFREVSSILEGAAEDRNLPIKLNPADLATMEDGRFNSYDPSFDGYLEEEGEVLVGPDYRDRFTYLMPEKPQQNQVRHNLRKSRRHLLLSQHYQSRDYKKFVALFKKTLDKVTSSTKQVMYFADEEVRSNRFSPLEELETLFPEVNPEPLERIEYLYNNLQKLHRTYRQPEKVAGIWGDSVTFFEELIQAYIDRFPREREG